MHKNEEIIQSMEQLVLAARQLRDALIRADGDAIRDAAQVQADSLNILRKFDPDAFTNADQPEIKKLVQQILELNKQNRDLSQDGLCVVRHHLARVLANVAYDASGQIPSDLPEYEMLGATA